MIPNNNYIQRKADLQVSKLINDSKYFGVLGVEQFGKSSLLNQLKKQLEAKNYLVAIIKLSAIDSHKWANDIIFHIYRQLKTVIPEKNNWLNWLQNRANLTQDNCFEQFIQQELFSLISSHKSKLVLMFDDWQFFPDGDFFFQLAHNFYQQRNQNLSLKNLVIGLTANLDFYDSVRNNNNAHEKVFELIELKPFTKEESLKIAEKLKPICPSLSLKLLEEIINLAEGHPRLIELIYKDLLDFMPEPIIREEEIKLKVTEMINKNISLKVYQQFLNQQNNLNLTVVY